MQLPKHFLESGIPSMFGFKLIHYIVSRFNSLASFRFSLIFSLELKGISPPNNIRNLPEI